MIFWRRRLFRNSFSGWLARFFYRFVWIHIGYLPEETRLWREVPPGRGKNGKIDQTFFKDKNGLSSDIALFSNEKTSSRRRVGKDGKPEMGGLVCFLVNEIRANNCNVVHAPLKKYPIKDKLITNYSHTLVNGELSITARKELAARINARPPVVPFVS